MRNTAGAVICCERRRAWACRSCVSPRPNVTMFHVRAASGVEAGGSEQNDAIVFVRCEQPRNCIHHTVRSEHDVAIQRPVGHVSLHR